MPLTLYPAGACPHRRPAVRLLVLMLALPPTTVAPAAGEDSIQTENRELELKEIRSEIRDVRSNLETARSDVETYLQELQEAEQAAVRAATRLRAIESDIENRQQQLAKLEQEQARWQGTLETQRTQLANQIRAAYKAGQHDFLKLLLNQEDPTTIGRMVVYHDYHNRARTRKINAVQESLDELARVQAGIEQQTAELKSAHADQQAKLEEYRQYRESRQDAMDDMRAYIEEQDHRLQHLQQNEQELVALLDRLKSRQLTLQAYEDLPPFDSLKGKLSWPIEGRFLSRYGEQRKGGRMRSLGVRIAAESGQDVKAVSAGRVIFADWFRTMGLLLIIDHGDGYMSLYGNNAQLLKKPGDMAATGEVIAIAGDTGGQAEPGVYFEIRRQGDPLNPSLWCRR